jgi:hypothetical protein
MSNPVRSLPRIGWHIRQQQQRREFAAMQGDLGRRGGHQSTITPGGLLSGRARRYTMAPELLWQSYIFSPYIRPCIDGISRFIKGKDWDIISADGRPPRELTATELRQRDEIKALFKDPNRNKGAWPSFIGKLNIDLLVYDAPAVEIVRGTGTGRITELVPLYGPSIEIAQDEHGVLLGYKQVLGVDTKPVEFKPEQLMYAPMYSTTRSPYGLSIIQTVVDQITYLLLSADHHTRILDRDEIPDGIAFASGIPPNDWQRFVAEARTNQGKRDRLHALSTQHEKAKIDWIQFRRASREEQLLEINQEAERIIVRNFGIDPTTAGLPAKFGSRAKAEIEQAATHSSLILPICDHWEEHFNINVVHQIPGGEAFKFKFIHPDAKDVKVLSDALNVQIKSGQTTVAQARIEQGYEPYNDVPAADRPMIITGKGIFFLDTLEWSSPELGGPSPPVQGVGRADVMITSARIKGHTQAPKVEELVSRYTKELKAEFEEFGREAFGVMSQGVVDERPIRMGRAERDRKAKLIKQLRDKYWVRWGDLLKRYAADAGTIGSERAAEKIGYFALDEAQRQIEVDKLVRENHDFMKQAWRRYTDRVLFVLNRATKGMVDKGPGGLPDDIEFDDVAEFEAATGLALAASVSSIEAYGRYMWAVENVIYAREAGEAGMRVFWHLVSSNPCPTCDSVGNQEHDPLQLDVFPGEGTVCDGRCYCFLEIVGGRFV